MEAGYEDLGDPKNLGCLRLIWDRGPTKGPSRAYPAAFAAPSVRCTGLLDLLGISSKYCDPPCVQWLNATGAAGRGRRPRDDFLAIGGPCHKVFLFLGVPLLKQIRDCWGSASKLVVLKLRAGTWGQENQLLLSYFDTVPPAEYLLGMQLA